MQLQCSRTVCLSHCVLPPVLTCIKRGWRPTSFCSSLLLAEFYFFFCATSVPCTDTVRSTNEHEWMAVFCACAIIIVFSWLCMLKSRMLKWIDCLLWSRIKSYFSYCVAVDRMALNQVHRLRVCLFVYFLFLKPNIGLALYWWNTRHKKIKSFFSDGAIMFQTTTSPDNSPPPPQRHMRQYEFRCR